MEYWQLLRSHCGSRPLILSGAACCIVKDKKILLVKNRDFGCWQIPGGFQETGESLMETAVREVREETGLNLRVSSLISVYSGPQWNITYPSGDVVQQLAHFFLMEGCFSDDEITLQEEEVMDYMWADPASPPSEMIESCREQLSDYLKFSGQALLH